MLSDRLPLVAALTYAMAFFLATIMGVVPNPLVGDGALFHTNAAHNLVHLGLGAAIGLSGLYLASRSPSEPQATNADAASAAG